LSAAEIDAHVSAVRSALTAQVDGRVVDLTPSRHSYPALDLVAAGGGTIVLGWTVAVPAGAQQIVVTDAYEPGGRTTVQQSVLVAPDPVPHDVGGAERGVIRGRGPGRTDHHRLVDARRPAPPVDVAVGARGTPRQAVLLGLVTTFTHTAAVLAVGGAVLVAGGFAVPEVIVPVLTLAAGAVVLVLGSRLVRTRWVTAAHGLAG
jgi:nickel/cobalt transporter (NicO) family protein